MTLPRQGAKASQRSRDALFAASPNCHWCGVTTLHPSACPPFDPNMATLDHVKSRRECVSFEQYSSTANHVLSCLECNQLRDRADHLLMQRDQKRQENIERLKKTPPRRALLKTVYLG